MDIPILMEKKSGTRRIEKIKKDHITQNLIYASTLSLSLPLNQSVRSTAPATVSAAVRRSPGRFIRVDSDSSIDFRVPSSLLRTKLEMAREKAGSVESNLGSFNLGGTICSASPATVHHAACLMARSQMRRRIVAIGAFYVIYHRLRRSLESRTLSKKYLMSYHNRHENMMRMVYESDVTSINEYRCVSTLCDILENRGGLKSSKNMLVDEQVAMFLHTLAHNAKNRVLVNRFHRSGETISRYFKLVLHVVCRLHKEFYKSPVPVPDNETDERWKWFKKFLSCLGALDGTYVKVKVPAVDRKPYRTRKGEICTNVLGVCTRDLLFTYELAGWEGSAADSRVLRDAYLCDAGYTNGEGFLTPYRGQRYHLND
ncbi:hypothetical protein OSB04_000592 [Centaurea solstitialis]|uniref:DDE Tnp4 domain-containing protein n=1 Tax=Centaurea solstitialis TaxID=347529 RepID=A0AA38TZX7_9ASTR|nr:hypothetical protein OSB04_000592 [Centaurea solstitialis]